MSTLQHSPCVSHLSLSQPLALSSSSSLASDTQTVKAESKVLGSRLNPVSERLRMLSQTFPIPLPPRGRRRQKICLAHAPALPHIGTEFLFTCAPLYMRVHIISAHETVGGLLQERQAGITAAGEKWNAERKRAIRREGDGGETRGLQSTTGA